MIERVSIRNWQSLVALDLELARFTVIVGPSSSGKSAFMRALRAVASNVSGTDKITRGQKNAAISVATGEATVTLEYGKFASDTVPGWYYRLLPAGGKEQIYTKLNRAVPAQVTAALRIDPVPVKGASINFAGQHDPPFLLQDSGAAVARTLGELTGVDRLFEAGREAVRRRNGLAATLRTREADLAELTAQAHRFAGLPQRVQAMREAEAVTEAAARLDDRINRLQGALDQLTVAEAALSRSALPEVPTDAAVQAAQQRLGAVTTLLRQWADHAQAASRWDHEVGEFEMVEDHLHHELGTALTALGTCPTCNQPMRRLQPMGPANGGLRITS